MENKINIAELLKDCPKGMELDCASYDNVSFDKISDDKKATYPIFCYITDKEGNRSSISFTENGYESKRYGAKCVIFPKGKTTWEGFQRPFEDGDIIFTHVNVGVGNTWISIFQENRNGGVATYVDYSEDGSDYYDYIDCDKALLCMNKDILHQRFATEEEKQKLFDAIKADGYYWNAETKTLEKLKAEKFNSQVCTSVEQSKRLLELGLKPETADMCIDLYYEVKPFAINEDVDISTQTEAIPAWSLHRLIEILDSPLIEFNILSYNPYEEIIYLISESIKKGYISKEYLKQ